jgi:hypothetical protein
MWAIVRITWRCDRTVIRNRCGGSSASPPIFMVGELVAKLRGEGRGLAVDGWLMKFHTYGTEERCAGKPVLLNNSFQPPAKIRVLRTYWRQRLQHVTGARAIVGGERDPRELAELSHPRIQASRGQIAKSLEGNWRQN